MTTRYRRMVAAGLVVLGFLSEVALTTVANSTLTLSIPGRQYSGQEILEIALRTGRGGLLQSTLDSFTLLPNQHLVAIGVFIGLALCMGLAAAGLALYAGTAGYPRTWGAWSLVPWPGSFVGLVALTLLPPAPQNGATGQIGNGDAVVKDSPSPNASADPAGSEFSDGIRNRSRGLVLGLVLIPLGVIGQLPQMMDVWAPLSMKLWGLHPPGAYYLSLWELAFVLLGDTLASCGLILIAHARGHHPAWGIMGMGIGVYGPVLALPFVLSRAKAGAAQATAPARAALLLALLGILLMVATIIAPEYLSRPLIGWINVGAFLCGVGLAIFARALGRSLAWGLLGVVPMGLYLVFGPATIAAPAIGLLALWAWGSATSPSKVTSVTIPGQEPFSVTTGGAAQCLALVLSAAVMQWFSWYWEEAPYLPFYLPGRTWPTITLGIVGLVLWMGHRGRHPAWSLLGLVPVAGPLFGLMLPPGRDNRDGRDPFSRFSRLLHSSALMLLVAGWLIWGLLEWGHGSIISSSVSPDGAARARVLLFPAGIDINFEIQVQRVSGMVVEKPLHLHYSGDQCSSNGQFLWTKDGSRVLMIGPRFCVEKSGELPNGQKLFFMHDVRTGQSWCNGFTYRCEGQPSFSKADVAGLDWDHPSALDEPAAKPDLTLTAPP
jgi:hypothetical protein